MRTSFIITTLALLSTGCAHESRLTAPPAPPAAAIREIRIHSIPPADSPDRMVTDRRRIDIAAASWAFAKEGWLPAGRRELLPLHRIVLVSQSGPPAVFWLGLNSHPPRFPCFALCSGWWVAPSTPAGEFDASRYKGLTSAVTLPLLHALEF
jgi:hypothetical protein